MSNVKPVTYRGRGLCTIVLIAAQLLVGIIHAFFGFWLLVVGSLADPAISAQSALVYSVYTLAFGLLTLIFTVGIWLGSGGVGLALLQFPCLLFSRIH